MEKITCPLCNEGVLSELAPQYLKNGWKCSAARCQTIFWTIEWYPALAEGRIVLILNRWESTARKWTGKYEIEITQE